MCVRKSIICTLIVIGLFFSTACNQSPQPSQTEENAQNGPALQPAGQSDPHSNSSASNQTLTVAQATAVKDVVTWQPGTGEGETAVTEAQSGLANNQAGLNIIAVGQKECLAITEITAVYTEVETAVACHEDMNSFDDFNYRIGTGGADLIVLPTGWFNQAAYNNAVFDLTHFLQAYGHIEKLPPAFISSLEYPAGAGQIYAAPLQPDNHMLVLRQDLFADAGLTAAASWQDLVIQVETLHAKGEPGFATAWCEDPACSENITAVWQEIIWSLGGTLWDEENNQAAGVLNSAENQTAVSLLNRLQQTNPDSASYTMADTLAALCNGSASVGLVWASDRAALSNAACAQADNLTAVSLPGTALVLGGSAVGVNPTAVHQEEALNFINWLMSADGQQVTADKQPADIGANLENVRASAVLPEYQQALNTQIPLLRQAILGQLTAQEALDTIADHQQNVLDNLYLDG